MKNIVCVGYDPEIIELIKSLHNFQVVGYIDRDKYIDDPFNLAYLGQDIDYVSNYEHKGNNKIVITVDNTITRKMLYDLYNDSKCSFANVISIKSNISKFALLGKGIIIQDLVNISYNVEVKDNVKINTGANLMHDVKVERNTTIAPNSTLLGYVKIGSGCFIGANSTILPHVNIESGTIIGAGCVCNKKSRKRCLCG